MSTVKMNDARHGPEGHQWPVWAARIALILSALVSLLTDISQAHASIYAPSVDRSALTAAILASHNRARTAANVPPLQWSDALAAHAARWAGHLSRIGYMVHSGPGDDDGEGENLWMGTSGAFSYELMVGDWADEARFFRVGHFPNISTTGNWEDTAHYTQMVWRQTRRVGCAVASGDGWDYLVCRYDKPGNIVGRMPY